MDALYVVEAGSYLRREGECLKVMRDGKVSAEIPACGLDRLTLVGYASLSGAVLDFLIRNRIETVFLTPTGRFRARLMLDEHPHVARRQAQYARLSDRTFALDAAKIMVRGKLRNQQSILARRAREQASADLRKIVLRIRGLQKALVRAANADTVRGIEGYGTRLYFEAFRLLILNPDFPFSGRTRRPPRDPVNALLSFVYTLLTNEVLSAVKAAGLDPYLGSLHEVAHGRPSLACDLVEEWRVLGDRLVLALINRRHVNPDDFIVRTKTLPESDPAGVRSVEMKPAVLRALIKAYERQMERSVSHPVTGDQRKYRWTIHEQVRQFGRYLEDPSVTYEPFPL